LAARRPRQELTEGHKIGVCLLVEPTAANHELLPEVADVSDRAAKAAHAELRESAQNFERGARSLGVFDRHARGHTQRYRLSIALRVDYTTPVQALVPRRNADLQNGAAFNALIATPTIGRSTGRMAAPVDKR